MNPKRVFSDTCRQVHRIWLDIELLYKVLIFVTPFLTVAFYFAFVLDAVGTEGAGKYGVSAVLYLFPPLGKESLIPLMLSSSETLRVPAFLSGLLGENVVGPALPVWVVWSMFIIMDIISSAVLAYNWWFAELIITHTPFLSGAYGRLQERAERFRRKKALTVSLLVFMIIPFQGTGGISTTIIARALGVRPKRTVGIVFAGSVIITTVWILTWRQVFSLF
jgi:uncharacterized membrane protein